MINIWDGRGNASNRGSLIAGTDEIDCALID
jgi:hypothetical protein